MQNNERPICHRAEDLVTYLYGEATAEESRDFANHLRQCEACRAEFDVFSQVHTSIAAWRDEALGAVTVSAQAAEPVYVANDFVQHERKLSALAALREFFSVSPLWLRGATAFAGLLLCALLAFAISRVWRQSAPVANNGNQPTINQQEFDRAVQKEVEARMAEHARNERQKELAPVFTQEDKTNLSEPANRSRRKAQPAKLTREETEQLAADLGLIPGREEELPFVLPEEPNQ
jgi:anti-sigma factor RsiW